MNLFKKKLYNHYVDKMYQGFKNNYRNNDLYVIQNCNKAYFTIISVLCCIVAQLLCLFVLNTLLN